MALRLAQRHQAHALPKLVEITCTLLWSLEGCGAACPAYFAGIAQAPAIYCAVWPLFLPACTAIRNSRLKSAYSFRSAIVMTELWPAMF